MWKCHKKLHRRLAGANCCAPVFVNHPEWGEERAIGPALPIHWITGIREGK